MNSLRMETEEAQAQNEELRARIKVLEQENLTKEQEITSLGHRNTLLEEEVDKLEKALTDAKSAADSGAAHSTEMDSLQRKLQLLEDEAEEADKNLRETNEKYVADPVTCPLLPLPLPRLNPSLLASLYPAVHPLATPVLP
jgi:tropomyosin